MELKEFIKNTLNDISISLEEFNSNSGNNEYSLNNNGEFGGINFDLSVIVEENNSGEGGGKINVLGNILGGELKQESRNIKEQRIKFNFLGGKKVLKNNKIGRPDMNNFR